VPLDGDNSATLLVTNKHVLAGSDRATITVHAEVDGKPDELIRLHLEYNFEEIIQHPDSEVDLCAMNISAVAAEAFLLGKRLKYTQVLSGNVPTPDEWDNLDAIEEVTMVGCPNGIYDEVNNLPIVRRGVTSSNPSKKYNGKSEFLVDMACFPGSSGSPIFLYNPNGYLDRVSNSYIMGSPRIKLLGVLYAGPRLTNTGQIILGVAPTVQVHTMMHLGNAIRSTEVLRLEEIVLAAIQAERAASQAVV
jgi:hypothetical protein